MAAPTSLDLAAVLYSAGVLSVIPEEDTEHERLCTRGIAYAVSMLKERTGWNPFEGTVQTRKYTGQGDSVLFLDAGLLSLTSLEVSDTVYTVDDDFYLGPDNAALEGKPYTRINFTWNVHTVTNKIEIAGTWGRMTTYDDTVTHAILACAAFIVTAELRGIDAPTGSLVEFTQGPVKKVFGTGNLEAFGVMSSWARAFDTVVAMHKRIKV